MALRRLFLALILLFTVYSAPTIQQAHAQQHPLMVRSIKFVGTQPVTLEQVQDRFKARNVQLSVERAYDPEEVKFAVSVLQELLTENGRSGVRVDAETKPIPPQSLEVTFRVLGQ